MSIDPLRFLTLILFVGRFIYWTVTEKKTKAKATSHSQQTFIKRVLGWGVGLFIALQLMGLQVFPFEQTALTQILGFLLVLAGTYITVWARITIGTNWAHAAEYQIKKDHELVTNGVYSFIRHPIYAGMFFSVLGAELVAGSYLFFFFLITLPIPAYLQAKKEEELLTGYFGEAYKTYMKKTKMFLPYIW